MGAASRVESEICDGARVERTVRRSNVIEICSVLVEHGPEHQVVLVLEQREQRQPQAPVRLVKSHRREMSPAHARVLAQLLVAAADRAESADG